MVRIFIRLQAVNFINQHSPIIVSNYQRAEQRHALLVLELHLNDKFKHRITDVNQPVWIYAYKASNMNHRG